MGYRNYIAILDKKVHDEIKDMSMDQLREWYCKNKNEKNYEDLYIPAYELSNEIYELGKYCDFQLIKKSIFSNPEVENYYNNDGEFFFINKEGLLQIIEEYRIKIVEYFKLLEAQRNEDIALGRVQTIENYLKDKLTVWGGQYGDPYSLDLQSEDIVTSWKYEYAIFELVRIYKSVDWENQYVCLTGH